MSSGDGWTRCAAGHRHWGLFGAAGLMLVDQEGTRVVLQHRAPWTHEGDSWGILGGARDSHESALTAALREASEEAALSAADVDPIGLFADDHGGWTYTTVVARARRELRPAAANAESVSVGWQHISEVDSLRLHTGFAGAWHRLRQVPAPLYLVLAPAVADDPLLALLIELGVRADRLPDGLSSGGLSALLPHVMRPETVEAARKTMASFSGDAQAILVGDATALHQLR